MPFLKIDNREPPKLKHNRSCNVADFVIRISDMNGRFAKRHGFV